MGALFFSRFFSRGKRAAAELFRGQDPGQSRGIFARPQDMGFVPKPSSSWAAKNNFKKNGSSLKDREEQSR
jgi:hypothetical protein